jgi:hypothetical protein
MTKSIEVRALEALVEQLERTIANLDKQVTDKCEETFVERNRTNKLIYVMQKSFPLSSRNVVAKSVEILKKGGDVECDLLHFYDATYEK